MVKNEVISLRVRCTACPLRALPCFAPFTEEEAAFMATFKAGELDVDKGSAIVMEGFGSPHLFTVLEGMGTRSKTLPDGRRQVIGFVFPGDLIGLQAAVLEEMQHTVQASTKMLLCVFRRADFYRLFRETPERGYDVSWLAAREEFFLGDSLLTVGRRDAIAKVAFGLWTLHRRACDVGLATESAMDMPFTQRDLADALGLSLVHTNKTLRALSERQVVDWSDRMIRIHDMAALKEIAQIEDAPPRLRPLI